MPTTITDELLRILRRQRARGIRTVPLSETTRKLLFEPRARTAWRDGAGAVPQPAASPRPTVAAGPARAPVTKKPAPPAPSGQIPTQPAPAPPPAPVETGPPVDSLGWEELEHAVIHCRRCPLYAQRKQAVFGTGSRDARLMFIGEGPGRDEDAQGIPFVGRAGQLLTRMIEAMQFQRSEVYIANIIKCRPPGNRNPEEEEATACLPFLRRQIALVKPEVIVLLGAVPLRHLLHQTGITRLHGQWQELDGIPVMPTFHPAYLLRVPTRKREAWEDLQKVMRRLGKDPANTTRKS